MDKHTRRNPVNSLSELSQIVKKSYVRKATSSKQGHLQKARENENAASVFSFSNTTGYKKTAASERYKALKRQRGIDRAKSSIKESTSMDKHHKTRLKSFKAFRKAISQCATGIAHTDAVDIGSSEGISESEIYKAISKAVKKTETFKSFKKKAKALKKTASKVAAPVKADATSVVKGVKSFIARGKTVREDTLYELKKSTLKSYISKASMDMFKKGSRSASLMHTKHALKATVPSQAHNADKKAGKLVKKGMKRLRGIETASDKLSEGSARGGYTRRGEYAASREDHLKKSAESEKRRGVETAPTTDARKYAWTHTGGYNQGPHQSASDKARAERLKNPKPKKA